MSEEVRVHVYGKTLQSGPAPDTCLNGAVPHTATVTTGKKSRLACAGVIATHLKPSFERVDRFPTDRENAGFIPFTCDTNGSVRKIDGAEIETDELREAQARRIKEFHDRPIAQR
jgi:hypothetical protein